MLNSGEVNKKKKEKGGGLNSKAAVLDYKRCSGVSTDALNWNQ